MVVEPSGFATDWAGSSMHIDEISADYQATVGAMNRRRAEVTPAGDPERAAEIIVRTVARPQTPTHLLLGVDAVTMALAYSHAQIDEATTWSAVSRSADFAEPHAVDLPEAPAT